MILENEFTLIHPECCGAPFAVPVVTYNRWCRDNTAWYCPYCGTRRSFNEAEVRLMQLELELMRNSVERKE